MDLAVHFFIDLAAVLAVMGIAWRAGRKVQDICDRLDTLSKNQGEMVLAMNKTNAQVQYLRGQVESIKKLYGLKPIEE